ncbi:hypothetical protein DERF_006352 [Dermatophagoides farinae]|uniref:Uncharacterized protein n=1 Tax=Dermatophagoides farinae TaxID=6954 RepID=A0A922L724_DERFA|nr:hypothetical protein DERF_006352 [Dermatophagoides farinae]
MKIFSSFILIAFLATNTVNVNGGRIVLKTNNASSSSSSQSIVHHKHDDHDVHSIKSNVIPDMSMYTTLSSSNYDNNRYNEKPEYRIPGLQNGSKINHQKLNESSSFENRLFGNGHGHYITIGNVSVPEEFFSPEAQGLWDWIKKGWNWLTGGGGDDNKSQKIENHIHNDNKNIIQNNNNKDQGGNNNGQDNNGHNLINSNQIPFINNIINISLAKK